MDSDRTVTAVFKKQKCGGGIFGLNLPTSELDQEFWDDAVRAIAALESDGWKQFNCNLTVVMNSEGSSATGLMQIMASTWVGENYGPFQPIIAGDICTLDGIRGNELYNLHVGEEIFLQASLDALDDLNSFLNDPEHPAPEYALLLEAWCRYHAQSSRYWNETQLAHGLWQRISSSHSNYADNVKPLYISKPWLTYPACACGK